ncbi:MAG: hypothetical protein ACON5I_13025 [Verrucomicrobiales bacterium]
MKILITLCCFLLISCRSNWDSKIGNYTYDNALFEHGPPDQSDTMTNGNRVCKWTLASGAAWVDKLILVFDKNGVLVNGQEKRY